MTTLTTRQRDILHLLLEAEAPLGAADLAGKMKLTPRQVNYSLNGVKKYLAGKDIPIQTTPGVGILLQCSPAQYDLISTELAADANFQLVLTVEQRQQLLALIMLVSEEPFILYQMQQLTQVSRTTVLKDLDVIAAWIEEHNLKIERRPNYGVWVEGAEQSIRQALAALIWGQTSLGAPLLQVTHLQGLVFNLSKDADLLPLIKESDQIISRWAMKRALGYVAYAESQLDGRFNDNAVLHLALALAIQIERVQNGHAVDIDAETIVWLQSLNVWTVAAQISHRLSWPMGTAWPQAEIALVAMHLLSIPRNERWPDDLDVDQKFSSLIDDLLHHVSWKYQLPELEYDVTLRDGIVIHTIPACMRHRFNLWIPDALLGAKLSEKYDFEHQVAKELAGIITDQTGVILSENDINNIAMLLRAAFIRRKPNRLQEVIVVCPSGMATAQLLVARLKARFTRIGRFRIVSFRELQLENLTTAELIVTTIPLPSEISNKHAVIQVHPMLTTDDIDTISQWLA
jgi:mannitol operon transcriptional antiterminator